MNLVVADCTFRNFVKFNSGAFNYGVEGVRSLSVESCLFEDCIGSGLRVTSSGNSSTLVEMAIEDCTFRSLPLTWQGALYLGGKFNGYVEDGVFEDIVARVTFGGSAGGIYAAQASSAYPLRIQENVFINTSTEAADGVGAIRCATFTESYEVVGNTIVGCSAPQGSASAIQILSSASQNLLQNNIIANCVGPPEAVLVDGAVQSDSNIFWNNSGGDTAGFSFGPRDRVADPLFCDPKVRDFTVREGSPCLPENSLGCGLIGVFGQGCGDVSVEPLSWGLIKSLYR